MNSKPTLQDFTHAVEIATRWSDLDALGHVNNTRFFTFDESARLDYFSVLMRDDPGFWKGYGLILARIECDFVAQLHHPAQLRTGFRISRVGRSSMNTEAAHFNGEQLIAISRGVVVWFDYGQQRPLPIPEAVRQKIVAYERLAPELAS